MRTSLSSRLIVITATLGLLSSAFCLAPRVLRAQALGACGPAAAVKAGLDAIPSRQVPAQTDWQFHEQRLAGIQALMKQYPDDLFVERSYADTTSDFDEWQQVTAEFKAHHEQAPNNPKWAYLYGDALLGRQTPEAIKLFQSSLAKAPDFPWPHLALVTIYNSPAFLDKVQASLHMKTFLTQCPESLEGYRALTGIDDKALLLQGAARLRSTLHSRNDSEALSAYPTLWSIEFKAHPPNEYEPLRKQVSDDLVRIRGLDFQNIPEWYEALEQGYRLVNDQKQSDWAHDERVTRFPTYELLAMSQWWKDHKWPAPDDPPEKKRAFYSDLLKQSSEWAKERPNATYNILSYHIDALEHLDDARPADVIATVDRTLKVAKANAGPRDFDSTWYFAAAELLSTKHLQPGREIDLAKKGLARLEVESSQPQYDLYVVKDNAAQQKYDRCYHYMEDMGYLVDGYLGLKQADQAKTTLAQMSERLDDLKAQVGDNDRHKKSYARKESAYWGFMARLAELQNRKLDAMAYYQSALLARFRAEDKPESGVKDEVADNAHTLWKSLGGTEEGWQLWYGRPANDLANQATLTWQDANQPLPGFELADLNGKTWSLAALKGKTTFLHFWSTW